MFLHLFNRTGVSQFLWDSYLKLLSIIFPNNSHCLQHMISRADDSLHHSHQYSTLTETTILNFPTCPLTVSSCAVPLQREKCVVSEPTLIYNRTKSEILAPPQLLLTPPPLRRQSVRVFAGVSLDAQGQAQPTATGRLCSWKEDPSQRADSHGSFGSYQRTLNLACDEGQPGILQWTPDADTPDTVYYQVGCL